MTAIEKKCEKCGERFLDDGFPWSQRYCDYCAHFRVPITWWDTNGPHTIDPVEPTP